MILQGDCLLELKELPDNSVDSIVTDPPYGLSFMGKKWDYDVPSTEIWKEALRVLKPGGHLLAFFGTRTYHRGVVRVEDAGFEIRDQIQWIYGSGFPKSHNIKEGDFKGWGTALKPANEPICVARKPLEKGLTVAENVQKWGCGALNIDGTRIATQDSLKGGAYSGPLRENEEQRCFSGGKFKQGFKEFEQPQGRWPANVIFDEAAAELLDAQSGKLNPGGQKRGDRKCEGVNTSFGSAVESQVRHQDSGGSSRFFYVAKASKRERNAGCEGMVKRGGPAQMQDGSIGKVRSDGTIIKEAIKHENHHPTVKPIKLMEYLIKLVTPPNGTVLDPFMGSGSTGVACKNLGFGFVGIELNKEYCEIAKARLKTSKQIEMTA